MFRPLLANMYNIHTWMDVRMYVVKNLPDIGHKPHKYVANDN